MAAEVQYENVLAGVRNRLLVIDSDINGLTRELRHLQGDGVPGGFYEHLAYVKTNVADTYKWLRQAEDNNAAYAGKGMVFYPSAQTIEDRVNGVWNLYIELVDEFTEIYA